MKRGIHSGGIHLMIFMRLYLGVFSCLNNGPYIFVLRPSIIVNQYNSYFLNYAILHGQGNLYFEIIQLQKSNKRVHWPENR
jgi:hypothetical protein